MRPFPFPRLALAAALVAAVATPALASPVAGAWRTPEEGGRVDIVDCGDAICSRIADGTRLRQNPGVTDQMNKDAALRTRPLKGLDIFEAMKGGPKTWRGRVYNPVDGGTYSGSVTLVDPNTLKLTGCIIYPFCKTQVWVRAR